MGLFDAFRKQKPRIIPEEAKWNKTYIEGRPELFETKVFTIKTPGWRRPDKHIAVFSRDPGSAAALIPVMQQLLEERIALTAVVDGRAEETMLKAFPKHTDITPHGSILDLAKTVGTPDLILTDASSSERGLETNAASIFTETPMVLIEDYYTTANAFLERLEEMRTTMPEVRMPERVCVMDAAARDIILARFPDLADRVVITGQPAFDRFASEKPELRETLRAKLELEIGDRLISYMGGSDPHMRDIEAVAPFIREVAARFEQETGKNVYFVYRKHPRDNTSNADYARAIEAAGLHPLKTQDVTTDAIAQASDVVMTNWSTVGIEAALRRIPVLYINDTSIRKPIHNIRYPLPPVTLGASVAAYDIHAIPALLEPLLHPESGTALRLRENMEKHYKTDGQNAARVVAAIQEIL